MKINSESFLPEQPASQARYVPSYLENQCQCQLCAYEYDLAERVPMMLCGSQHTCCLFCVKEIIMRKKQCPFCRKQISLQNIHKNRMLCKILEQVARKKGIQIKINQNPQKSFLQNRRSLIYPQNALIPPANFPPDVDINIFLNNNQNIVDGYQALLDVRPAQQSCCSKICQRIDLKDPLYFLAFLLVMVYNFPFFICELNYALNYQSQSCLDQDYGVGMSLRAWLKSSAIIGLSMYGLQILVFLWKICFPGSKRLPKILTTINIIAFFLKFLAYNLVGFVLYGNIDQTGSNDCSGSVLAYMQALFIIQFVIVCSFCSVIDRRRR